jgi:beta-xylosidase
VGRRQGGFVTAVHNPILPGCYPDPTICRVGSVYYLVNSTFEYFPGLPVFRSRDLVHWEQLGNALDRPSQLSLPPGTPSSGGVYAPTLRYHDGRFWLVTSNGAAGVGRSCGVQPGPLATIGTSSGVSSTSSTSPLSTGAPCSSGRGSAVVAA